ncbi:carboxylating nicotinate-nucleotide diphosphorylase [Candidatus Oleimmundimicrobium sp.]|uniref:carboxylating nicotinate-nucleotide diphosphorylase n=1 Tax=Candidatus Oleimmundimicrobium sp. TaxID=3060597 RepID=UPI00271A5942|nr:carboxylating nicotinate-nucleotide diphosphorylase [Candidatus Oleimmundimicrobium sp.]MDO8885657.1 carboxylating nicotinate-nucleotide diphosphorylase [Candidatus Oleimmundimicrobium sp.]
MIKTHQEELEKIINNALKEDLGTCGDITTQAIFPTTKKIKGFVQSESSGILAGIEIAAKVFEMVDSSTVFKAEFKDGDKVKEGQLIAKLEGDVCGILSAERVALNFLQHLSGIATLTSKFVKKVKPYKVDIYDTRKTTPGLRLIEKYAVKVGGGCNHRMGLYDAILIKDNHIAGAGSVRRAIEFACKGCPDKKIEVETENLEQVKEALETGVDIIMLDNMDVKTIKKAVEIVDGRTILEASGGITLDNVEEVAKTGVDRISVGAITQASTPLNISIELK